MRADENIKNMDLNKANKKYIKTVSWLVGWVLWHIKLCMLFNAK